MEGQDVRPRQLGWDVTDSSAEKGPGAGRPAQPLPGSASRQRADAPVTVRHPVRKRHVYTPDRAVFRTAGGRSLAPSEVTPAEAGPSKPLFGGRTGRPRTEARCGGGPSGSPEHRAAGTGGPPRPSFGMDSITERFAVPERQRGGAADRHAVERSRAPRVPGRPATPEKEGPRRIGPRKGREERRFPIPSGAGAPPRRGSVRKANRKARKGGPGGWTRTRRPLRRSAAPRWSYGKRGGSPCLGPHRGRGPSGSRAAGSDRSFR